MEIETTSQNNSKWSEFYKSFLFQIVVAGAIWAAGSWLTSMLTQNSQAAEIRRHDEQIKELQNNQTPRLLFDERTQRILDDLKSLNDKLDEKRK